MFAALWLPVFRLQAALRWRDVASPAGLVDGDAAKGTILEINSAAEISRVQPGLTPAQALARCPALRIVSRSIAQEAACHALLVELALEFSPRVEATRAGLCTLDLSGAAKGVCWQRLAQEMVARCAAEGFEARVGVADRPDHAWLAACRADPVNVVYDGAPFCAALPIDVLEPSAELAAILEDWGVRTVGEFLKLPAQSAIERLGPEAARLRRNASARSKRVLRLERPVERHVEAFDFDYAIETTEPLLFLLRRFVDCLSSRLRAMHRVAAALTLTLPTDNGPVYTRTFSIPTPTADADAWFRILSTHLEELTLDHQPVGVRLRVDAAAAAGKQLHLFESSLRDPNRFGETLARLKALVGEAGVGVPQPADSHEPGAFRAMEFVEAGDDVPILSLRGLPLRRHRRARHIAVKHANGRPSWIEGHGPVVNTRGPFGLSGGWWDRNWRVMEWDVEAGDGQLLRIAWRPGGRWTVEGSYDVC